jgi:hypothetical protein
MPNLSVSDSTFFWESFSRFQRFTLWLGFEPAPLTELKENLNQFSLSEYHKQPTSSKALPLHRAVAYLADNSDPKVEKIVKQKLSQASSKELHVTLSHLVSFSIHTERPKMLDVCSRVLQLDAIKKAFHIEEDIQPVIQGWDRHIIPQKNIIQDSDNRLFWKFSFPGFRNFRYFRHYIVTLIGLAYGIDFTERPTGKWAAQYQLSFFRSTLSDLQFIGGRYLKYFSSTRKAILVAAALFATFAAAYLLYSKISSRTATTNNSKPPPSLDKQLFTDLTEKARAGLIPPAFGIEGGMNLVETCLSSSDNTNPLIVILLGPPGSGKTRYPEELARRIANKETACLNDKRVYIVNTADMDEKGSWTDKGEYLSRMGRLFESVEGSESEVIVCFDEAHMFDRKTANQLKTKLMQRKIRTIFATTPLEFGSSFLDQEPLISRGQIRVVGSLNRENTECALLGLLSSNPDIHATPKAVEELLNFSATLQGGAEPRKSLQLLSYLIHIIHASVPRLHPVVSLLMRDSAQKKLDFDHRMYRNPVYDFTDEGKEALKKLKLIGDSINQFHEHHAKRLKLFTSIKTLLKIQSEYRENRNSLTKELARIKDDTSKEKEYLILRFATLPFLDNRIKALIQKLNEMQPTQELQACLKSQVLEQSKYDEYSNLSPDKVHFIIDEELIIEKKLELEENNRSNKENSPAFKKHFRSKGPIGIKRSNSQITLDDDAVSSTPSVLHKPEGHSPPSSPSSPPDAKPTPVSISGKSSATPRSPGSFALPPAALQNTLRGKSAPIQKKDNSGNDTK